MWSDNETEKDFLNFSGIADTVAEIVIQAQGRPISVGVAGAWGVGKSSMIKLIRASLTKRMEEGNEDFVFVEFNAWLYQDYDDARAALLEVIANTLAKEAKEGKSGYDKACELLKRVDWIRTAKLATSSTLALALGLPPTELVSEIRKLIKEVLTGKGDAQTITDTENVAQQVSAQTKELVKPKPNSSPPKEIRAIRKCFEQTLSEMDVRLVVLIDDLDRCLPPTTISTLEAIRLFLFLKNTAFIIAADDAMIKHAVRHHFDNVDDTLVTNYFDKLIQVPIRVPPLGTQEVRAYMMLLFVGNSELSDSDKEDIRINVCNQLAQTWQGKRVDRAFMQKTNNGLSNKLLDQFETADRLAPLMTTASQIGGNPRLIKRFLNALSIRMTISNAHSVSVDEAALAKMLLFERCAAPAAYDELTKAVNNDDEGKPRFLAKWEKEASEGKEPTLNDPWDDPFIREWLTISPCLASLDLRGILYVSREHAPLITPEDRLSSEGAEVLAAILEHPDMAERIQDRIKNLPRPEIAIIMDRVLERAYQEQEWGTPPILNAALAVSIADPIQGARLASFLRERPPSQIKPAIVPKIDGQPWSGEVFDNWCKSTIDGPVKKAITTITQKRKQQHGNV